jgi:hypothetical protein
MAVQSLLHTLCSLRGGFLLSQGSIRGASLSSLMFSCKDEGKIRASAGGGNRWAKRQEATLCQAILKFLFKSSSALILFFFPFLFRTSMCQQSHEDSWLSHSWELENEAEQNVEGVGNVPGMRRLEEVTPATFALVLPLLQRCYHGTCIVWFCKRSTSRMWQKTEHSWSIEIQALLLF